MTPATAFNRRVRHMGVRSRDIKDRLMGRLGVVDDAEKLAGDAQEYWRQADGDRWKANSHWREAGVFDGSDLWSRVGRTHLELYRRLSRLAAPPGPIRGVLEWGCGGGANAVHFAGLGTSFVGVDVAQETLDECGRQLAAATSTPYHPILVDVNDPEAALDRLTEPCDLFVCFYVFELIPSQEYGARLLRVAHRALADGGVALIQVKYDTGSFYTRPRRRRYRTGVADMTTYRIDAFWSLAESCGFVPEAVHLVPRNELDERYAYFLLSKQQDVRDDAGRPTATRP